MDKLLRLIAIAGSVIAVACLFSVLFNIWLGARRIGESAIFFAVFAWVAIAIRRMARSGPDRES